MSENENKIQPNTTDKPAPKVIKKRGSYRKSDTIAKAFAREYVSNGFNGKRAYKAIKPNATDKTAEVEGSKALVKPKVMSEIEKLLPKDNEDMAILNQVYQAEKPQSISWSDVHKFWSDVQRMKGRLNNKDNQQQTNIGIIIEQ